MTDPDPASDIPELERRARAGLALIERVQHDVLLVLERHGGAPDMEPATRWLLIHATFEVAGVLLQEAITAQGEPARTRAMTMARDLALYLHGHPSEAAH